MEHNIIKYNSKVVYFQNTTRTKTYVDYFTIIISGKMNLHNGIWLIFNNWMNLCLRLIAYPRVNNLPTKMRENLMLHEPFRPLYCIY